MKLLLAIVLILGSAVVFTIWALEDPGRGHWTRGLGVRNDVITAGLDSRCWWNLPLCDT